MFFKMPDGERFNSKCTKRGQYAFGVACRYEWLATAGPNEGQIVSHWTLTSQHLTKQAAIKKAWGEKATMAKEVRIIQAM